jgi:hypothetical protein
MRADPRQLGRTFSEGEESPIYGAAGTVVLFFAALAAIGYAPSGELAWPLAIGALSIAQIGLGFRIFARKRRAKR